MGTSIPGATLEKFTTFGDLLRYLRRASGLTQLELSVQVGYSHAQISRLEQNLRIPDIPTVEARFVPALGLEDEPAIIARLLELAGNVRREDAPGLGLCPYKGLSYFEEADSDLFVGREALTARLTERVLGLIDSEPPSRARFLAVVGASGSGKSSLVRAGLIPSLRWTRRSADWHIHVLTPTAHPLESLAVTLTSESESVLAASTLMDDLGRDLRSLQIFVRRQLTPANDTFVLLVIDQFEETFALCHSEEERGAFIGNLLTAASETRGPVILVLTLRADFYAHCAAYIELRNALAENQEYIGAMTEEELRRSIEEPARRGRWELEPGLVDLLLHDVGHEPGALPLLSHALFETWQRRRGRMLTMSGYASSGGVRGAIAETAEMVFTDKFNREQRAIARRIFLRLTELGDEAATADTRRRATFNELILKPEEASTTRTVLKALADARLIITGEDTAEVAHEALIREWPTLQGWLEENREGLRLHRQLTETAQEWLAMNREPDLLYRGARLVQAREWSAAHADEMNPLEHEFLAASIEASERESAEREAQRQREVEAARELAKAQRQRAEAERQRAELETERAEEQIKTAGQLRKRAIYLAVAFTLALVMAVTALFFSARSREAAFAALLQQKLATSRELALASVTNLDVDPERSILLALEALDTSYTIEAEDALHRAIQASRVERVIQAYEPGAPMMVALNPEGSQFVTASPHGLVKTWDMTTGEELQRFEGFYAAYSPDGKRLAVLMPNRTVTIIDMATGEEIPLAGQIDAGWRVAFSPDGTRLATDTANNIVKVWDTKTGRELASFRGHTDLVGSISFSADGTRLLTASDDRTARVWNVESGQETLILRDHPGWVTGAQESRDGKWIVTTSAERAFLWDAASGEQLFAFAGHTNTVLAAAFSPEGTRLATASWDRKIILWDLLTGKELLRLSGHAGAVFGVVFSQAGNRLISSSNDGTVRLWDVGPNRELLTIGMNDSNGRIAFNIDSTQIASTDKTTRIGIWHAHTGRELIRLPGAGTQVSEMIFGQDGKRIFAAGFDGTIRTWDIETGEELAKLAGHTGPVTAMAASADGTRLLTASQDHKVRVWDILSNRIAPAPRLTLQHSGKVFSVAWSSDNRIIASGLQEGNIILWDAGTGKEIQVVRGHADIVSAIVFHPDGTKFATSSLDGTARVWDMSTGEEMLMLATHTGAVTAVAYSPDGTRIGTVSEDGTAKLWDASTGEELLTLLGGNQPLYDIRFSPDGKLLATGSADGIRLYILQSEDLIALAKTRLTRSLTPEECRKYLHRDQAACAAASVVATTTPLPPADRGRVCQVTSTAGLYDHSFNESQYRGLQDASTMYRWDARVLQSASVADFARHIREFLRGDCDLIVGLFPMADALREAAEGNPEQKFYIEFEYEQTFDNIWMQRYATDQAAFLAGYTAASVTRSGKVGVFGGVDVPGVTAFMDGFALGVDHYNRKNGAKVELLGWDAQSHRGLFVGDFCCAAEGRQVTEQLLDQGADIILPVAGPEVGAGALHAVKTHGNAFLIGVDTDWALTQPEYRDIILTSVMKNYRVSVVRAVKAIEENTFAGGIYTGTLETGEVGLAPFYELDRLISTRVKADLDQITSDIISGQLQTRP